MKLTGGEIILKKLFDEKVPYILGIPGHGVLGLFDAIRKADDEGKIKYIQVKHEQTATSIADGYYRVTGKPLAVFASIGPGTLNTAIGLGTSYVDSTAFLMLAGETHTNMRGVGVLQEVERYQDSNIIRSLEPLSKRSWRAENVLQLPKILRRAFNLMSTGRPGPCVMGIPMDVQADSLDVELMSKELGRTECKPSADAEYIAKAVKLMKTARRPVILAGGGALRANSEKEILALAEKWGAAVVTTLAGKGAVAESHPQYAFHTGSKGTPIGLEICRNADVILAVGARFADETCCSYRKGASFNFPDTKLIHIDIDVSEIGKNYGADVGIVADLKDALVKLNEQGDFVINKDYLKEITALRENWFTYLKDMRAQKTDAMTISQLIGKLNEVLPDDTIIATSSGNTQAQLFQEYVYKKANCNLTTGGFSTMGWAVPAAIGAQLADMQRPVVALLGDGDFMMIMQELSTIAQYEIPVIVIMVNNSGWMAIKDLQHDVLGGDMTFGNDFMKGGEVYSPDFVTIAKAFGIDTYDIKNLDNLGECLDGAIKARRPAFVYLDVSREHPYTGGKAFGWWDVPIPGYLEEKRKNYEAGKKEENVNI
ncbi:MAG: thiamine pyrophosphate-binding protein [Clostridia bacterium]|nr:thiamine pyrophosphate-binding protein [Clostridia bacterium]